MENIDDLNDKNQNAFYVNYLLECKYCSPDTKWIFMPDKILHNDIVSFFMEDFDLNLEVNFDYWETFPEYPLVSKGTELLSKNCNSNVINKAVHQLSYAYINRFIDHIDPNNIISCTHGKLFFLVPIIVTTAELWKINPNTTIETIEKSKDLSDIATSKDLLLYQYNPDNMMQKYFQEKLRSLDKFLLEDLENHLKTNQYTDSLEEYFQFLTLFKPSSIIIMNYKSFKSEFKKLNSFFGNKKLVKKR